VHWPKRPETNRLSEKQKCGSLHNNGLVRLKGSAQRRDREKKKDSWLNEIAQGPRERKKAGKNFRETDPLHKFSAMEWCSRKKKITGGLQVKKRGGR